MKEVDTLLKTLSDALKGMSQGIKSLADRLDVIAQSQSAEKPRAEKAPQPSSQAKPAAKAKKEAPPKTPAAAKKTSGAKTATREVFDFILQSPEGIDTAALMEKTGYDRKKIHNIIYKLKKQEKISSDAKGNYRPA